MTPLRKDTPGGVRPERRLAARKDGANAGPERSSAEGAGKRGSLERGAEGQGNLFAEGLCVGEFVTGAVPSACPPGC